MGGILLVDLASLSHRAMHAAQAMHEGRARPSDSARRGVEQLLGLVEWYRPARIVLCGDSARATLERRRIDGDYKRGRDERPERFDARPHLHATADCLDALGLPRVVIDGWEADDVCASLAAQTDARCIVVSSDRDLLGALTECGRVRMHLLGGRRLVTEADCVGLVGVRAANLACYKALAGDAGDSIPGIRGVGPKAARRLIGQFGSFARVVERREGIGGRVGRLVCGGWRDGLRSFDLALLRRDLVVGEPARWEVAPDAHARLEADGLADLVARAAAVAERLPVEPSRMRPRTLRAAAVAAPAVTSRTRLGPLVEPIAMAEPLRLF